VEGEREREKRRTSEEEEEEEKSVRKRRWSFRVYSPEGTSLFSPFSSRLPLLVLLSHNNPSLLLSPPPPLRAQPLPSRIAPASSNANEGAQRERERSKEGNPSSSSFDDVPFSRRLLLHPSLSSTRNGGRRPDTPQEEATQVR